MTDPTVRKIATAFSGVLHEWFSPEMMAEVIAANNAELNPDVCHSHDFCDANEAMLLAFERAIGREPDVSGDEDTRLWNAAWDLARSESFSNK